MKIQELARSEGRNRRYSPEYKAMLAKYGLE
jgi:hypothetical protein